MLCSLEALFFFARELHENGFRGANIKGLRDSKARGVPNACAALCDGGARRRRGRARGRSRRVRHRARSSRGPLENERANAVRVAE